MQLFAYSRRILCLGTGKIIIYALTAVLVTAAFARAGWLFWDWSTSKERSSATLESVQKVVAAEILTRYYKNFSVAVEVAANLDFEKAFALRDRDAVDKATQTILHKNSDSAYDSTTILQNEWKIFYSSDGPESQQASNIASLDVPLIDKALDFQFPPGPKNPFPCGLCSIPQENQVAMASFVPLKEKKHPIAVLAVSTEFGPIFLKELEEKISATKAAPKQIGLALYVMQGTKITAESEILAKEKPGYINALTHAQTDPFEDKSSFVEADGRLWKNLPLWGPDGKHPMGQILISQNLAKPPFFDPIILISLISAIVLLIVSELVFPAKSRLTER